MTSRPDALVSVVVPNHNYGGFIVETLDSVLRQTYDALELIVVDDGSSDGSREVIEAWCRGAQGRFRRIRRVYRPRNLGKIGALNRVLPEVQGDVVLILDADDSLVPGFLSQTVEELWARHLSDPSVAFVYTDCQLVDARGLPLGRGTAAPFDRLVLQTRSYIPECGPTLTKALLPLLPLDDRIRVGTKHHKWKRLVSTGWTGHYVAEPLFFYRMHDRNLSGIGRRLGTLPRPAVDDMGRHWPTAE